MSTIFKIIGYRNSYLSEIILRVASSSNLRSDNMSLESLKDYIGIRMSEMESAYKNTRIDISDDKMFVFEDGKLISLIIERYKI